jgi:ribosomal protein S18 acetylase RimI-like enzyme
MAGRDKPAIMKLLKNTPEFEPEEVVVAEELLDSYVASPADSGYYVLVAEIDSIVGYVCYGPVPLTKGSWDIYWMAVDREEQNKGIGKKLIQSAEEGIRKQQGRLSFIETSSQPSYEKTRRFHIAQGYQQICRVADFYSPGDDKIIYQKRLS